MTGGVLCLELLVGVYDYQSLYYRQKNKDTGLANSLLNVSDGVVKLLQIFPQSVCHICVIPSVTVGLLEIWSIGLWTANTHFYPQGIFSPHQKCISLMCM